MKNLLWFTFGIVGSGWLFPMLEKCKCRTSLRLR